VEATKAVGRSFKLLTLVQKSVM